MNLNNDMYERSTKAKVNSRAFELELVKVESIERKTKDGELYREEVSLTFKDTDNDKIYETIVRPATLEKNAQKNLIVYNTRKDKDGNRVEVDAFNYKWFHELFMLCIEAGCPAKDIDKTGKRQKDGFGDEKIDATQYVKLLDGMKGKKIGVLLQHHKAYKKKLVNALLAKDVVRNERNSWEDEDMKDKVNVFIPDYTKLNSNGYPDMKPQWIIKGFFDVKTRKTYKELLEGLDATYVDKWEDKMIDKDGDSVEEIKSNKEVSDFLKAELNSRKEYWNLEYTDDDFDHELLLEDEECEEDGGIDEL